MSSLQILTAIQDANQILNKSKLATIAAFGSAFNNPAFDKIMHAQQHLAKQAAFELAE